MTIHAPREGGDPRAYHAHLLTTTREVTAQGLGAKSSIELGNAAREQRGLLTASDEYKAVRGRWAELVNEALREAHIDARVDHRSLAAQGINREPGPSIPHRFMAMERQGIRTTVAEQIRENYRRRVESRAARMAQVAEQVPNESRKGASPDQVRREAVQAWLQYRERQRSPSAGTSNEASRESRHERDDPALGNRGRSDKDAPERRVEKALDNDYSL
jgi:hypothetical protein